MQLEIEPALTFDDVLLEPSASDILPSETDVSTNITKEISIQAPLISSPMDTVTTAKMAIAMAQEGGIGCIHKNMSIEAQAEEVTQVKKYESSIIIDPVTIHSSTKLQDAMDLMLHKKISSLPVVERDGGKLVGILTNRDVRFIQSADQSVTSLMTKDNLITVKKNISEEDARQLLHQHRIEKLIVVDDNYKCIGLITFKNIDQFRKYPNATKDSDNRLRTAAAIGTGEDGIKRAKALIESGVDIIVVDTAHGASKYVIDTVKTLKKYYPKLQVIGGNIATAKAAEALIDVGVDAVKVGVGPGSICTTRVIAGVGVPQLSAIMNVSPVCKKRGVCLIADGGIKYSGDIAKAIAAGADSVMLGSLFAGTAESPGQIVLHQGKSYKPYRGMGSIAAMQSGSAGRYFQDESKRKLVSEGIEGMVPYRGSVSDVIYQLVGGLKASMGYTGNKTIKEMQTKVKMIKISNASLRENHPHDIIITQETPNYWI
jgi:IMP dehydrogenase